MRMLLRVLLMVTGVGVVHGAAVYNLRDSRFFPNQPGVPFNQNTSAAFTSTTSAVNAISFSTNPGDPTANTFDAISSVSTGPFALGTNNSVTIGSATTTDLGILSIVQSGITEGGVTVTGGSGTGYLLPTFHVFGVMNNNNSNATVGDNICAGNNLCALSSVFGTFGTGVHNVNGFYTPSIGTDTSFQFGTPFTFFFFFGSGIEGSNGNPGGPVTADLRLQFEGFQVVDSTGQAIPGAQIHSAFLDAVSTPEPGTTWLVPAALLVLALPLRRCTNEVRRSRPSPR